MDPDQARHMAVVTSSRANAEAKWVEYEWLTPIDLHKSIEYTRRDIDRVPAGPPMRLVTKGSAK